MKKIGQSVGKYELDFFLEKKYLLKIMFYKGNLTAQIKIQGVKNIMTLGLKTFWVNTTLSPLNCFHKVFLE
jgi:hypothetical protein